MVSPTKLRIVQCWDDGVTADIPLIEILSRHGAKATFNINAGLHGPERKEGWKYKGIHPVSRLAWGEMPSLYKGFTIANHSVSHPHPSQIPLEKWKVEVADGRKRLQDHFSSPVLGFAYPFGDFGQESHTETAVMNAVRAAGHTYARTCENSQEPYPPAEPMRLASHCHFASAHFWDLYEGAKKSPARVFYFWGHSYEMVSPEEWGAFEEKISRMAGDGEACFAELTDLFPGS